MRHSALMSWRKNYPEGWKFCTDVILISCHNSRRFLTDVITRRFPDFNDDLIKPSLQVLHVWIYTSHRFMWTQLFIPNHNWLSYFLLVKGSPRGIQVCMRWVVYGAGIRMIPADIHDKELCFCHRKCRNMFPGGAFKANCDGTDWSHVSDEWS